MSDKADWYLATKIARWLALDQHFGQSDQGAAAQLVRELAVDRARLLRRIDALETAMHPLAVADVDAALAGESAERLAEP